MIKTGPKQQPRPRITQPPKLLVVDGQLVIDWPPGPKPTQLVITTAGYEAMVAEINRSHALIRKGQQIVASLVQQGVQSPTDADQPAGQPGVDTSMSATPP